MWWFIALFYLALDPVGSWFVLGWLVLSMLLAVALVYGPARDSKAGIVERCGGDKACIVREVVR
jgi:hypothetical protein